MNTQEAWTAQRTNQLIPSLDHGMTRPEEATLCKIRNNGCRPAVVVRIHSTKCKSPECSNTRLPGYLHGLCSKCNTTRLNQRRSA